MSLNSSEFLAVIHGQEAGRPVPVDLDLEARVQSVVRELIREGLLQSAHDCAEGGLAVALAEGRPMAEAIRFANTAAALSVTRLGAQASIPERTEVEARRL